MSERGFERPWARPTEEALQILLMALVWIALMLAGMALL